MGCSASLTGQIILPEPSHPINCDPWELVNCLSQANASPEDLHLRFSNEQLMAISGGFVTILQYNQLMARVAALELLTNDWTTINQFLITLIQPPTGGVISLLPDNPGRKYNEGAVVQVEFTVDNGYAMEDFFINGVRYIEDPEPGNEGQLIPFTDVTHTVTLQDPAEGATLSVTPDKATYQHGETITVECDVPAGFGLETLHVNEDDFVTEDDAIQTLVSAADIIIPVTAVYFNENLATSSYIYGPAKVAVGSEVTYELKGVPYNKELDHWKYNGVRVGPTTNGTELLSNDRITIDPVPDTGFNLVAYLKLK